MSKLLNHVYVINKKMFAFIKMEDVDLFCVLHFQLKNIVFKHQIDVIGMYNKMQIMYNMRFV